ncbi:MAG: hypothetical protein CBD58_02245 [bacterium TMED198]|nr:MAG: hypothetical protein CBD58_02245 [bacterium TMED198]
MFKAKYLFLLTIFSFVLPHKGHSHQKHTATYGSIRGRIIDHATKSPKQYANVSIKGVGTNEIITGGISDENGYFILDEIPFNQYNIIVSYIGYKDKIIQGIELIPTNNTKINLGDIEIFLKVIKMESVQVEDKAATIIEEVEKTTYIVDDIDIHEGESAADLLEKLPSITFDIDGRLNLRGNSDVTIMIDGRESKINLNILNSNLIEKIEIMTTPSAKYDPEGMAGIINIVLSKNKFEGSSGSLNLNTSIFNKKRLINSNISSIGSIFNAGQNMGLSFNYFKNDLNVFTNYNINFKKSQSTEQRKIIYTDLIQGSSNILENNIITNSNPFINNLRLGIEKFFDANSLLAFDMTYLDHAIIDSTNIDGTDPMQSITDKSGNDLNYGIGYFYDNKDQNKNFSIEFDYDDHDESFTSKYDSYSDEIIDIGINKFFSLNYSSPFLLNKLNSRYETGLRVIHEDDIHGGKVMNEGFDWVYDNFVAAAYFSFDYTFSNHFSIKAGSRIEQQRKKTYISYNQNYNCEDLIGTSNTSGFCNCIEYDTEGNCLETENSLFKYLLMDLGDDLKYNYAHKRFYPSLFLIYNTHSDATYKLSLSRRINRPSHHEVNPVPDLKEINNNWINQGNPFLNPEDIYTSEFTCSFKTLVGYIKTSVFLNKVNNLIDKDMASYRNPQGDKTYIKFTSRNIAKSLGKGFDIYFSTSPTTSWDIIFNGIYWHNKFTSIQENSGNIESGFSGKLNSILRLNNNQEIGLYSYFSSTTKINRGKIKPLVRVDLNYKKIINDNLIFKIKIKDLFNTNTYNVETKNYLSIGNDSGSDMLQKMDYIGQVDQRTLSLNLEYKFGAFQKKKYRRDNSSYEENKKDKLKF